jgi:hypothetical protein
MSFEAALVSIIKADETLNAMVSGRVHPLLAVQGKPRPYLAYHIDDLEDPSPTHTGPSGWLRGEFSIVIVADTYEAVTEITPEVTRVLQGYEGTSEGVEVAWIKFDSQTDVEQDPTPGTTTPVRVRQQTYRQMHRAT